MLRIQLDQNSSTKFLNQIVNVELKKTIASAIKEGTLAAALYEGKGTWRGGPVCPPLLTIMVSSRLHIKKGTITQYKIS